MNTPRLRDWKIDREWTLFLDRDGVINRRLPDEYVRRWSEFEFLPNVLGALSRLAHQFGVIVMVTNQRGIGRNLMTEHELAAIHAQMLDAVKRSGGRIDRIYHCPHDRSDHCDCRKPAIGLAVRAKHDFPAIDFARSIMVGDSPSDMEFAERAGLRKIWIGQESEKVHAPDFSFSSLHAFAEKIVANS
jgi:histidinol-phosphate phosphatase family protein